ncbi:MAG: TonB-dependent receptor [Flavobacteriales bacterium]|nr:TonB-dependent receptor [Flavobacteriales bacterium]
MKNPLIFLLFLTLTTTVFSQTGAVKGFVVDSNSTSLPFARVFLKGTENGVYTDENGKFELSNLKKGNHTIVVSFYGYKSREITFELAKGETKQLNQIPLQGEGKILNKVTVETKSITTQIKEEPLTITVVDVEPLKNQNLDVNQVLNSTSGIRIRESGGLGSDFNFSLNGFSGRQVRFFTDGVPMDNFGSSLSLNNIPVNLISRIEVYKGVVPVHLGADALGGAVNIVTNKNIGDFLDVSYSVGSFNTHRASVLGRFVHDSTGFVVNANAFFNYSDNDYEIEVEIADLETGAYGEPEKVKRFHDAYQSQMAQLEVGFINKKFADRIFLGLVASGNYKEIQNGSNMTQVAGEIFTEDKVLMPTFKYQKRDLFTKGLDLSVFANYNIRQALTVDTSSNIYNWRGEFKQRDVLSTSGELTWYKTLFRFDDRSLLNTVNLNYEINDQHSLSVNNTFSTYTRVGDDPITYGETPFKEPNTLQKNITGLSYQLSLFNKRLKSILFGKHFSMNTDTRQENDETGEMENVQASLNNWGYGVATTFYLTENFQLKGSYENAYRLPDAYEMFGNGLLLLPNLALTPEKSHNFNVGFLGKFRYRKHELLLEGNYLYRLPENLIRLQAIGVTSNFENLTSAKANIFEGGIKYRFKRLFQFEVNGTYQNIVNNQETTPSGGINYLYGDRLPNQPFLFGNFSAGLNFNDLGNTKSSLSANWSIGFVEAFYLKWPSQGNAASKYDIPRQISHSVSLSYALKEGRYNISVACTNLFDKAIFDNFMLQKPGRAFNVKLRCFINKKR